MTDALARVEILHFRYELPQPLPTTMGPMRARPAILLRAEDEDGAVGWGEIWCNFPPDGDLHRARLAANVLGAALEGVRAGTDDPFALVSHRLARLAIQSGEPGPVAQIAAGVDIALHDLAARRAGRPLAEMLGGTARPVPAYASGISPMLWEDEVERMRALGYRRFKMRVGFGPDDSLDVAEALHARLSPGETLMLDANQAWDLERAQVQCARLGPLGCAWMEEPMSAAAPLADWSALAATAPMPLAAGENLLSSEALRAAIANGALAVLQPDMCKWGGFSGVRAIARDAIAAGLTYCPHFLGGGIGLIASAHLLSAVGGSGLLEVDSSDNPLLEIFGGRGHPLEDGCFPVSTAPGLGTDPDVATAADMLVSRTEVRP